MDLQLEEASPTVGAEPREMSRAVATFVWVAARYCILDSLTVDDYIASKPEPSRAVLERVRETIRAALPDADESISYNMPTYKVQNVPVLYFAGWKSHFSLYPSTAALEAVFKEELAPYEVEKGTIRFSLSDPPPLKLIADLAIFRAREIAVRRRPESRR